MKKKPPIFQEVSALLKEKINKREFVPGIMLPSESELCGIYSISRASVRKALDLLDSEGLIYRQAGVGTFIREREVKNEQRLLNIGITNAGSNLYTEEVFKGASEACSFCNAQLVFSDTREFIEQKGKNLDGFVILSRNEQLPLDRVDAIAANGIPIVFINRFCDRPHISYFSVDYELESKRAVEFLYRLGRKDVAMVDCPDFSPYVSETRSRGYRLAADGAGKEKKELAVPQSISAVDMLRKFLRLVKPDALFITSIIVLDYAMLACKSEGLEVGKDIMLFCFDRINTRSCDYRGNVIYANMPLRNMAEQAIKHIVARHFNPYDEPVARKLFNADFIINSSTM